MTDVEVEDQLTLYTWPGWIEEEGQRVESVVRGQARMDVGQNSVVLLADTEVDNAPSLMLLETREPSDLPAEQVSTVLSDAWCSPRGRPQSGEDLLGPGRAHPGPAPLTRSAHSARAAHTSSVAAARRGSAAASSRPSE